MSRASMTTGVPVAAFTALLTGIGVLAFLWTGPLVALSAVSFSAHMILHLSIVSAAAPLIALGLALMPALPLDALFGVRSAVVASLLDMLVVWLWHAPALHEAAALDDRVFLLQQASFLGAGLLVWTTAFSSRATSGRVMGGAALLGTFLHMTMLGVLLGVTPRLLYSPDVCIGAFGVSGLKDQWLGGVLMATLGAFPYLLGALALIGLAIGDRQRRRPSSSSSRSSLLSAATYSAQAPPSGDRALIQIDRHGDT